MPNPSFPNAPVDPSQALPNAFETDAKSLPVAADMFCAKSNKSCACLTSLVDLINRAKAGLITSSVVAVAIDCFVIYVSIAAI